MTKRSEYKHRYDSLHKEQNKATTKKWLDAHPGYYAEKAKKQRLETIAHYGGKCIYCGDTNTNHLTIDHIYGGGNQHRKMLHTQNLFPWLKKHNYPEGFQVLCWNHNAEKQYYDTMTPDILEP